MRIKISIFLLVLFTGCFSDYTPKPRAYFKLYFPEKEYSSVNSDCPYTFELPNYSTLLEKEKACFYDVDFPMQGGKLHVTYLPLKDNLDEHIKLSAKLAYKHNLSADAISEQFYIDERNKVYGVFYNYEGITATAAQFFLTDSTNHFFRAALYFNSEITDSIVPINTFLKQDIKHLIETFRWKDK